jgi:hypothetical protein
MMKRGHDVESGPSKARRQRPTSPSCRSYCASLKRAGVVQSLLSRRAVRARRVAGEPLGDGAPGRLIVEVEIAELLVGARKNAIGWLMTLWIGSNKMAILGGFLKICRT